MLATVCHTHQVIVPDGSQCPGCAARDQARRSRRNVELGRKSAHWRRLSARLIRQARGVCSERGCIEEPADPWSKLTCDLIGGGDHSRARAEDCRVLCRRCHGREDGGRR